MHESDEEYEGPSKSQIKRDALAVTEMGQRLLDIPDEQLDLLPYSDIVEALREAKKITKGNAKKRQLQYVGKLLRKVDLEPVTTLLDRYDTSSAQHNAEFHQLENWRERLIEQDPQALEEIFAVMPAIDRQQLRQLMRNAIKERAEDKQPPVHFRKLFQFLKSEYLG